MKQVLLIAVMTIGFTYMLPVIAQNSSRTTPTISMDQYAKKITQRINKNFSLTPAQRSQVHDIVSKYGEVPAGKDIYTLNSASEREILEILNTNQMLKYKQSHSLLVLPAAVAKPVHNNSPAPPIK